MPRQGTLSTGSARCPPVGGLPGHATEVAPLCVLMSALQTMCLVLLLDARNSRL